VNNRYTNSKIYLLRILCESKKEREREKCRKNFFIFVLPFDVLPMRTYEISIGKIEMTSWSLTILKWIVFNQMNIVVINCFFIKLILFFDSSYRIPEWRTYKHDSYWSKDCLIFSLYIKYPRHVLSLFFSCLCVSDFFFEEEEEEKNSSRNEKRQIDLRAGILTYSGGCKNSWLVKFSFVVISSESFTWFSDKRKEKKSSKFCIFRTTKCQTFIIILIIIEFFCVNMNLKQKKKEKFRRLRTIQLNQYWTQYMIIGRIFLFLY